MNNSTAASWRKSKAPQKRRKLNDTAIQINPEFFNENLPIHSRRLDIMSTLASTQVLIIQGDTGCGKTTQIPKFILQDYPEARIAVTQPRRLAAVGVARRVAKELNTTIGNLVGYHIRGERTYGSSAKIVFMTTGMFIQELVGANELQWTHIILDEVHERAIETEFLLVVLKHMLYKSNTKLILMSATIDAKLFANYFADSEIRKIAKECENQKNEKKPNQRVNEKFNSFWNPIFDNDKIPNPFDQEREDAAPIRLAGPRNFTVKEVYLEEILSMLEDDLNFSASELDEIKSYYRGELVSIDSHFFKIAAYIIRAQHLFRTYEEAKPQTFLIFLPGIHEISKMAKVIAEDVMKDLSEEIEICLLHSSIPEESHGNIFNDPEGKRRIIISTNIAESSITLPDVRYIIDFGLTKELIFNSTTKCERLQMLWGCKAVMQQRAGRAGRVAEGVCYRLMNEEFYQSLKPHSVPEIQRCPLDKLVLKVKQLNIGSPQTILIRAIQPPNLNEIISSENYLREMGALNEKDELTWLGRVYADMPCDVKISRLCLFGYVFGCLHEAMLMGAAISQEKPVFISCAHLDYKFSQYEANRYAKRLMWDNMNHSDPIAALSAYKAWYAAHGKRYVVSMKKGSFSRTSRQEVQLGERNWCKANGLDYNVLREVSVTYQELKRRLKYMGLAKQHLTNRLKNIPEDILTIKLCIAAAYNEKYLTSFYAHEDEVQRRKKEQLLKERQASKVIIPGINSEITINDINEVLKPTKAKKLEIEIDRETAIVTFDPTESIRPLQMCLWLGTFPQRYRCGNFIVPKKYLQDKNKNRLEQLNIDNVAAVMQKVAYSQPRDGMKIEVEHAKLGDKYIHIEAFCLQKPEYIYKLNFQDFITGSIITLDDTSVCKIVLEENPAFEKWHLAICGEMIEKRNRTIATNVTLMPSIPLLPHLLTLCFTREVSLFESNNRYGGIKVSASELKFNYTFTGKDIEEINEIRKEISMALFDEKGILNPAQLTVKGKIIKLINKKRMPYIDEKWRKLLNKNTQEINNNLENQLYENVEVHQGSNEEESLYLRTIKKIATIKDDLRNWTETGQNQIELEMLQIRAIKEQIVLNIKKEARLSKITRPEVVCKLCDNTVCAYFNAAPVSITPVSGIFKLACIFGTVRFDKEAPPEIDEGFAESIQDMVLDIEEWAYCMEGHLIGWKNKENCYINHKSLVSLMLPDGKTIEWGSYLWRNGYDKFINECKRFESISNEKKKNQTNYLCDICCFDFKNSTDFFNHVIVSKEHTENVTKFLREGY